ncbi:enoyl-CoA hydratase-related protein [Pseudaestuariivita sp.]|uniref:enoyl-CoA hydratase-related protein n=1 Tax=Pseudaestuariivita sp. TaxID=2211669 RepID=UPI004059D53D
MEQSSDMGRAAALWSRQDAEGVATLRWAGDGPPVLMAEARAGLMARIDAAEADAGICAILVAPGGAARFPSGPDLLHVPQGWADAAPSLEELTGRVAGLSKPLVVALAGRVVGAGAALSLAAHWRVVAEDARLGWGDLGVGDVPRGGVTQRLPRLVGAGAALDVLLSGRAFPLVKPMLKGCVDRAAPAGELIAAAQRFAASDACKLRPTDGQRAAMQDGTRFAKECTERRTALGRHPDTPEARVLDCVEAAPLLPVRAGLALEREAVATAAAHPIAKARRALALAERAAQAGGAEDMPVVIAGEGAAAIGYALAALEAGRQVVLIGAQTGKLSQAMASVYDRTIARGRMKPAQRSALLARLTVEEEVAALPQDALVVVTDLAAAQLPWGRQTPLAVADGAAERALDGHPTLALCIPQPVARHTLVETRARGLDRAAEARLTRGLLGIGRMPVASLGAGPFAHHRLWLALTAAVDQLVIAGTAPSAIDRALREAGWALRPFEMRDATGLAHTALPPEALVGAPEHAYGQLDAALVAAGRPGLSARLGYYRYTDRTPHVDAAVAGILAPLVTGDLALTHADIVEAVTLALANAGAALLSEGVLRTAGQVDLVAVHGLGVPRDTGALMTAAQSEGLPKVALKLKAGDDLYGSAWRPHPFWEDLLRGKTRLSPV